MSGWVYIFDVPKLHCVKIGYSGTLTGVDNRLRATQTHLPADVSILTRFPGSVATERWLHRKFAKRRIRGEWFVRSHDIVKAGKLVQATMENPAVRVTDWRSIFKALKVGAKRWNPHRWNQRFEQKGQPTWQKPNYQKCG